MTTDAPHLFRIIVGTYERLLYGCDVQKQSAEADSSVNTVTVTPVFIYPAHISCIKAAAASNRFLATGSTDEHIKLYDLRIRKEVGTLMHHSGTTTSLQFYKKTHLFTASEDGTIAIVRTSDWEVLKTLDGHKRAVNWIDVHPSGKVLLSVGGDGTMKCWDLAKGACAYSMKLPKVGDRVKWSPSGSHYAILMGNLVHVHAVEDAELVGKVESVGRINAIVFTTIRNPEKPTETLEVIVTGSEDRSLGVYAPTGTPLFRWNSGHGNRIKDIDAYVAGDAEATTYVVSCSSDGGVRVWDLANVRTQLPAIKHSTTEESSTTIKVTARLNLPEATPIGEYIAARSRLTCLTIASPAEPTRRGTASQASKASADQAADGNRSEAESDYDDPTTAKPTVTVSFGDAKDTPKDDDTSKVVKNLKKRKEAPSTSPADQQPNKKRGPKPVKKGKGKDAAGAGAGAGGEGKGKPAAKGKGKEAALAKFQKRQEAKK
ncbi:WD40-repeat-containing domain protein [Fimicolochytrium jonesii]|uniref:WD40-repeat-containing domain protein n=1 Tax=Fimicolochytrium jonesii TaxID=1396493 RepID=UPI0022FE5A72|nr:WD40-repeat-containing domain protein [Fimicolochytrium jonesii]KAI8819313.1 WD40-repeat-containing domain protein [Fimicolochytrium jonesii]